MKSSLNIRQTQAESKSESPYGLHDTNRDLVERKLNEIEVNSRNHGDTLKNERISIKRK